MAEIALLIVAVIAGSVASITGFGIGSLITPVLSLSIGTKLGIAVVAIPHFIATALRFSLLRSHVDKRVLLSFGLMSAIGGMLGALLHARFSTPSVTLIFGGILAFTGFMGVSGLSNRMQFRGPLAWAAGMASGFFGGIVGNQGGIRSAALLGFQISKESFVATATAIGLIIDIVRMPIYFWSQSAEMLASGKWIAITSFGVVIGTLFGAKLLTKIPDQVFRPLVSGVIFLLGIFMLIRGWIES